MKIKTKLMLSLSILIVCIMLILVAVTHIQFYIIRDYAYFENKITFESLRDEFEAFYAQHDDSWNGVQDWNFEYSRHFVEIALIVDGEAVYQKGYLSLGEIRESGYPLVLRVNDQKIGRIYVMNESQHKTFEFRSMWYNSIFPNVFLVALLFTCFGALVTIVILSWRLTAPIRKIVAGIDSIKRGRSQVVLPVNRKDEFGTIARALQEMNDSLASLEQSRKQLMSDVAHELKTPLMIMQGELELAQEMETTLSSEKISSLLDEVLRLSRMVHDVLDLSKMEAGATGLRPTSENIVAILEELIEKIQFLAEDKQIRMSLQASEDVIKVSVEKQRILQALYNILTNACHYTNHGGQVKVHIDRVNVAAQQNEYVQIAIEDNGIGIPAADLPHVFNRFYRAEHSRSRPSGGTGLGLAIAQQNILAHRGWIEVRSAQGSGTIFLIFLPMLQQGDAH